MSYKNKLTAITTFIFDVDGVLTNGQVLVTTQGELLRSMNIKDGYALKHATAQGYKVCIISGGTNPGVTARLNGLGITDVFLGKHKKITVLQEYMAKHNLKKDEVAYMGDDMPDIEPMKAVGLATCPQDAVPQVKAVCDYVSHKNGGFGCGRDLIEQVLKVQGKWD
jgi:3-deoxy-D-manno-octulosonate 8-phosphate phosphatase (KDO 8-P phosphatase)